MKHSSSILKRKNIFLFCSLQVFVLGFHCLGVSAQDCPKNIGFENGTFEEWDLYVGFVVERSNNNVINLSPTTQPGLDRHTMYTSSANSELDPYGNFPINCPNGSGHSIKLGNTSGGALAEGVSYEFTIPAGQDLFTLIYHYAVVFQEPPHLEHQQPRFEIEVTNVSRDERMGCSSFMFRPFGPLTPGFGLSYDAVNQVPVWYKDWTTVAVKLDGYAGQTIRLFFKTADCTYFDHFSYAYIDVSSECNGEFLGAKYCPGDTLINLTAPFGYQNYAWHNNTFTQVLGTSQTLSVSPQVAASAPIPVEVYPFHGYGCLDTFYATVADTLKVNANAGPDILSCNSDSIIIGGSSAPELVYTWSPSQGLSDPAISNPLAHPDSPTTYILTVNSIGGGCVNQDTVFVNASSASDSLQVIGKLDYCIGSGDSLVLGVQYADRIQWFRDNIEIIGASQQEYRPTQTGTYHAALFNNDGCSAITPKKITHIDHAKQGISYPVKYIVAGTSINLNARNFGDIVLWKPAFNLNDPNMVSPVFTGNSDQLYTIDIKTISECTTVDTQMVKMVSHPDILVPTAFTPNQDGLNDILRPVLFGIKELRYFKIFNRWGQLLFETKNSETGWDGKVKAVLQLNQVVVWMAEGLGWDNKVYFRKGISTILR
jgi:gliding motility-associated-like protein